MAQDPWAKAAAVLARTPGASVTLSYQLKSGGPAFDVPAIPTVTEVATGGGRGGRRMRKRQFEVARLDLRGERSEIGDLVGIGSEGGWSVAGVETDTSDSIFLLTLTRQD